MIFFVDVTAVFILKSILDKIGEHSITWNFEPQYFPKQPKVGHLPVFFFYMDPKG